jgi:hypothetical protein
MFRISVSEDFTKYPYGRYRNDGPNSGEEFRDDHLIPALKKNDLIEVILDGAAGYGSSFLEEAFGGLVRKGFKKELLRNKLIIVSKNDPTYVNEIWGYIDDADQSSS